MSSGFKTCVESQMVKLKVTKHCHWVNKCLCFTNEHELLKISCISGSGQITSGKYECKLFISSAT